MDDIAIKVIGLSKKYELGKSDGSISNAEKLRHLFKQKKTKTERKEAKEFYALKDLDFEIKKGEAVGIIGRNGAGKSTLLKILSGITEPSSGRVELNGSVASVLEVGTGFHPELTGRENIYLSGAMLGIPKKQIESKFDEIVEFAGVQKFIDTPVKHYSSGMYVRLAFSVITNVDADILLFDEVLSVGDLAFQMKCNKKIKELVDKKKTVLLVSHNMNDIQQLCKSVIYIEMGKLDQLGSIDVAKDYFEESFEDNKAINFEDTEGKTNKFIFKNILVKEWLNIANSPGDETIRIRKLYILNESNIGSLKFYTNNKISINLEYEKYDDKNFFDIGIIISSMNNMFLALHTYNSNLDIQSFTKRNIYTAKVYINADFFNNALLSIGYTIAINNERVICYDSDVLYVKINQRLFEKESNYFDGFSEFVGPLRPKMFWEINAFDSSV